MASEPAKPVVIDFCCCSGALSRGYQRAGFRVVGVDIDPQPNYAGDEFLQGDAVALVPALVAHYRPVAVLGSPPCQSFTPLNAYNHKTYPNLIGPLRERFIKTGLPYVIENVPAARAHLIDPVEICAGALGRPMIRHRLFEAGGGFTITPPEHLEHKPCVRNGYVPTDTKPWMSIHGGKHSWAWLEAAAEAMEMPWVNRDNRAPGETSTQARERLIREVCEAVPPVVGEWIGRQLMDHVTRLEAAA